MQHDFLPKKICIYIYTHKNKNQDIDFFTYIYIIRIIVQSHYCEMSLVLLLISLNYYFHSSLNKKKQIFKFF